MLSSTLIFAFLGVVGQIPGPGRFLVLVSMVCGSPPIHPPSRYQMFRLALILDVTSLMARAKRAGPRGSPCWTPVAESGLKFP